MIDIKEKRAFHVSGWAVVAIDIILIVYAVVYFIKLLGEPPMTAAFL